MCVMKAGMKENTLIVSEVFSHASRSAVGILVSIQTRVQAEKHSTDVSVPNPIKNLSTTKTGAMYAMTMLTCMAYILDVSEALWAAKV